MEGKKGKGIYGQLKRLLLKVVALMMVAVIVIS